MKKVLSFVFFPCFAIVVNLKIAYPNAYFLSQPPKKTIPVPPQQPNFERSSVGLYKYLPQTGDNIKKNYLRFTMSGKMYNHWLLLLKEMTAKPTPAARLRFYKL